MIATLEGHENEVKCVAFDSRSEYIATCSRDKTIWIWKISDDDEFDCVSVLQEHTQDVKFVKFHPTLPVLFSCSYDDTIRIWRENEDGDWTLRETLHGHASTVWSIAFSPTDATRIVSVGADAAIKCWKISTYSLGLASTAEAKAEKSICTSTIQTNRTLYTCDWKEYVACGGGDDEILLLKEIDGVLSIFYRLEHAHDSDVNCLAFHPSLSILASCSDDFSIKIWQLPE